MQRKKQNTKIARLVLLAFLAFSLSFVQEPVLAKSKSKCSSVKKSKKGKKSRKSRRHYNPNVTRAQAINMICNNSEEVASLAGLEGYTSEGGELPQVPFVAPQDEFEENEEDLYYEDTEEQDIQDVMSYDMETFKMLWLSKIDENAAQFDDFTLGGISKKEIMGTVMDWLGTPYRFGARSRLATDCSAFVQSIFQQSANLGLPRTAREQYCIGIKVKNRNDLQFGDLVFFHTYSRRYASHVGIYLGDDLFVHASSRYGVTVTSLETDYYRNRFIGGRRLSVSDLVRFSKSNNNEETTVSVQ